MQIPEPGDMGPPLSSGALTRTDFVRYAGASNDFNPMHHDDTVATGRGEPSVFGHGMLSMGLMASYVSRWFPGSLITSISARFRDRLWPGDEPTASGSVLSIHRDQETTLIGLELQLACEDRVLLTGQATVVVQELLTRP